MGFGDIHGRASVDRSAPSAFGICDDCGFVYNLVDLKMQMEFRGLALMNTGFRKCASCMDMPQAQFKPVILPTPDPKPILNARVPNYPRDNGLQGFTQYLMLPTDRPETVKATVLATIAELSGVDTPAVTTDSSGSIATGSVSQVAMALNAARTWLVLYNPAVPQLGISFATASFGSSSTILIGPGTALFWANEQGGAVVNSAAIEVVGYFAGQPFYAWEA